MARPLLKVISADQMNACRSSGCSISSKVAMGTSIAMESVMRKMPRMKAMVRSVGKAMETGSQEKRAPFYRAALRCKPSGNNQRICRQGEKGWPGAGLIRLKCWGFRASRLE